jgi:hypothetical protein
MKFFSTQTSTHTTSVSTYRRIIPQITGLTLPINAYLHYKTVP